VTAVSGPRTLTAALLAVGVAAVAAGCGSSSEAPSAPPANAAQFPDPVGKTLAQLAKSAPEGAVLVPSVSSAYQGDNRLGFGLFTKAQKQINRAQVVVYTADKQGRNVKGPYPAQFESLAVKPAFQSHTVANDPAAAKGVYVAHVPFPKDGPATILGMAKINGKLRSVGELSLIVGADKGGPPQAGDKAILIHTPTLDQVGGDASKIDTRVPPATQLSQTDFATVLGKKPVVLLFATPALCKSRVCGPVEDITAQVASQYGGKVTFIHQEIYNDNDPAKGFRSQVGKWRLPTEPWAFAIDKQGKVVGRLEGAFSAPEMQALAQKAMGA
jgi:hypothetical protein